VGIHEDLEDALCVLKGAEDLSVHELRFGECAQAPKEGTGLLLTHFKLLK